MRPMSYRWFMNILVGALLFSAPATADKLNCKNHNAFGEGSAPASLSENSSQCSMTFGSSNNSSGNRLLSALLQGAPQDARQLRFNDGAARNFRQQFNVPLNGPFDAAVVFFQALRALESVRQETSAVDVLDALFYVISGSAAEQHEAQYRRLLDAYWSNRSSISSSLQDPLGLISQRGLIERSYGSLKLTLGAGCLIADIDNTRFIASIAQSLRTEFRNCGGAS